jgi:hypothetical protein
MWRARPIEARGECRCVLFRFLAPNGTLVLTEELHVLSLAAGGVLDNLRAWMDPVTEITEERTTRGAWTITTLLFVYMLINFADKAVVGLAAVPIMRELNLSPKQFGLVGSSFSFLFSLSAILVGFAANRVATRWVLLALAFSWAVVQFPMVGAAGIARRSTRSTSGSPTSSGRCRRPS